MAANERIRCTAKHTRYQPTDEEWACPKCGTTANDEKHQFINDYPDESAAPDCPELHDADELSCSRCERTITGRSFAAGLARKKNLVPCAHCGGKGLVSKKAG